MTRSTAQTPAYRVLYDGQCEICQDCVSWLNALDHENKTICLPISTEVLSAFDHWFCWAAEEIMAEIDRRMSWNAPEAWRLEAIRRRSLGHAAKIDAAISNTRSRSSSCTATPILYN